MASERNAECAMRTAECVRDCEEARKVSERFEEEEIMAEDEISLGAPFYSAFMMSLMACGRINDARFVWKRMPEMFKGDEEVVAVRRLLQSLWNKEHERFYADLGGYAWTSSLASMVSVLAARMTEESLQLIERSFVTIRIAQVAGMTGTSIPEAKILAEKRGWCFCEDSCMVTIPARSSKNRGDLTRKHLKRLSEYVTILSE